MYLMRLALHDKRKKLQLSYIYNLTTENCLGALGQNKMLGKLR
jgi:hypothetical protein